MKTKKILALVMATLSISCLFACNDDGSTSTPVKTFTALANDETLHIGTRTPLINMTSTDTQEMYFSYVIDYVYTLHRTSYSYSNENYISYGGYYYYWTTTSTSTEAYLGTKTTVTTVSYSYLPYAQDECIAVKYTTLTETSFNYQGGFFNRNFNYNLVLNDYFLSYNDLKEQVPELANQIDVSKSKRYYVDTVVPTQKSVSTQTYTDTYFYITKD